MTVSSAISRADYDGNGVTVDFVVPFRFLVDADLRVIRTVKATGAETVLTLDSLGADGYSVAGAGDPAGGSITVVTAPSAQEKITILCEPLITQLTDYISNDPFPSDSHERALDRLTMIARGQAERLGRALIFSESTSGVSTKLPLPVAFNLLGWDATADRLENFTPDTFVAGAIAGATFTLAVSAAQTVVDISGIPDPWAPQHVYYNGIHQSPSAWSKVGTTLVFTEALPVAGEIVIGTVFAGPGQLNESEVVAYTPLFAGGVTRTQREKNSDVVSVKDFGAVGDGVTDDTVAFEAAKAAGGLVNITKATGYTLSGPVVSNDAAAAWLPDPTLTWDELTDGGKFSLWRGRTTDSIANGSNIWRFSDRAFFGYAASAYAGNNHVGSDGGNSWLSTASDGPAYLTVNAGVLYMSGSGDATPAKNQPYGIVSAVRASDTGTSGSSIAVCAAAVNDSAGTTFGRCFIGELQHQSATGRSAGMELAMHNASNSTTNSPYGGVSAGDSIGIVLFNNGMPFGPATQNPLTAAIRISAETLDPALRGFNSGIVFSDNSLSGTDPEAIAMAQGHRINWYEPGGTVGMSIVSNIALPADKLTLSFGPAGMSLTNPTGTAFFVSVPDAAVNRIQLGATATGGQPLIQAAGDDANLDIHLVPKGTGNIRFGTHAALAAETITGYITIKDSAGNPRKLAVVS